MPGYQACEITDADNSVWALKVGVGGLVRTVKVAVHVTRWAGPQEVDFAFRLLGDPVEGRLLPCGGRRRRHGDHAGRAGARVGADGADVGSDGRPRASPFRPQLRRGPEGAHRGGDRRSRSRPAISR
ncbi:hypothetical protein ACFSHP_06595 [Novosphingobium panipatense]